MANLTTLALYHMWHLTIGQLLDFFESAPLLLNVELTFATPKSGAQDGRLVSLARLRWLLIHGPDPPSLLLDHMLIPAGADMITHLDSPDFQIEDHLPRSLDNLRNLSNFTKIGVHFVRDLVSVKITGPNGRARLISTPDELLDTSLLPRSLAILDTSKSERLQIIKSGPPSEDLRQTLLSMNNLRTIALSLCQDLHSFILALNPSPNSMDPIPCPKLERLIFRTEEQFDIETMVDVAAARALGGAPLRSVKIINHGVFVPREGVMELLKHVLHVETSDVIDGEAYDCSDDDDEED